MLFQSKPTVILYLRRQDVVFIDKSNSVRYDIPSDLLQNLEVSDAGKLAEAIADFLESRECHGQRILLVLDSDVVFQKTLSVEDTTNLDAASTEFESKIPFEPANRLTISYSAQKQLHILATNRQLVQAVAAGTQKANKLKAAVPATLYGVTHSQVINRQTIATFFNDAAPLSQVNFLIKV